MKKGGKELKEIIVFAYLDSLRTAIAYRHCQELLTDGLKAELFKLENPLKQAHSDNWDEL